MLWSMRSRNSAKLTFFNHSRRAPPPLSLGAEVSPPVDHIPRGSLAWAPDLHRACHVPCGVGYWALERSDVSMNADDFRRIALSLEGAEESSHHGQPDFRVGGRIFATLASAGRGYGNLMLTPEQQAAFVEELPEVFVPIAGGWGRMGATHIRLAAANEDLLAGALRTAWKLRVEKNAKSGQKKPSPAEPVRRRKTRRKKK